MKDDAPFNLDDPEVANDPRRANLCGAHLSVVPLRGTDLSGADLSGADLGGVILIYADLDGANLISADLVDGADLIGANLDGAQLGNAHLDGAYLNGAHLNGAHLIEGHLCKAQLRSADLTGADLTDAELTGADLTGAHLKNAQLIRAQASGAILSGADLTNANMPGTHLSGVRLAGAILKGTDLSNADLTGADLTCADLTGATLNGANLTGANLNGGHACSAQQKGTDLTSADLTGADLTDAKIVSAEVKDADFSQAHLQDATFQASSNPLVEGIAAARNLEFLTYVDNPSALVHLQKQFAGSGFLDQEGKITYALNRRRAELDGPLARWFNRVAFDLTCQYGMNPGRPLKIWFGLFVVCWLAYAVSLLLPGTSGIYRVQQKNGNANGDQTEERIHARPISSTSRWQYARRLAHREFSVLFWSGYFSLMSAFNIGFPEINLGQWLRLLPRTDYDLKAKGWPRTVAGFQSLLSVYLVALWALTYFGHPFE